jgi:hypothetical protein
MSVGERLSLELRHDFTYLHPETMDARCSIQGDTIRLEHPEIFQNYRVVILPGSTTISAANLAKVRQFFDAGGKVIATTRLPDVAAEFGKNEEVRVAIRHIFGPDAVAPASQALAGRWTVHKNDRGGAAWFVAAPSTARLAEVLAEALPSPDVAWTSSPVVRGGNLSYLHKEIGGRDFYFFANSSDTPVSTVVRLRGEQQLERWDPHTGKITPQTAATEGGVTRVSLDLPPVSSVFFVSRKTR